MDEQTALPAAASLSEMLDTAEELAASIPQLASRVVTAASSMDSKLVLASEQSAIDYVSSVRVSC